MRRDKEQRIIDADWMQYQDCDESGSEPDAGSNDAQCDHVPVSIRASLARSSSSVSLSLACKVTETPGADWSILSTMKIATGKVVDGKVVLEGVTLEEGSSVTVLARDEQGGITLTPEEEAELLLTIAEADRGETVSAEEVLAKLARRHG